MSFGGRASRGGTVLFVRGRGQTVFFDVGNGLTIVVIDSLEKEVTPLFILPILYIVCI